jgi:Na+/H+-dicarboxylate symporter
MKIKLNKHVKENLLTILTISSVVLGIVLGVILRLTALGDGSSFSERTVLYVNFIGDIFLRMLKSLILPLIISSLVAAVGGLDISLSKKIGTRAILYYTTTTVIAVVLGIVLVTSIRPGVGGTSHNTTVTQQTRNVTTADTMLDLVRNIFPPNIVQASLQQYQTVLTKPENGTDDLYTWKVSGHYSDGMLI